MQDDPSNQAPQPRPVSTTPLPPNSYSPPPTPPPLFMSVEPPKQPKPQFITKIRLVVGIIIFVLLVAAVIGVFFMVNKQCEHSTVSVYNQTGRHALSAAYDELYSKGVKDFTANQKQKTLDSYYALSASFHTREDFYKDPSNMLIGLGIAHLYSRDSSQKNAYRNELYSLVINHLAAVPSGIHDNYFLDKKEQQDTLSIFNRYKDTDLTAKLNASITSSNLPQTVAQNLKLDSHDTAPQVNVIALNFDNISTQQQTFAKEHYMYGAQPTMWVEDIGGDIYILLTRNYATSFIENPSGPSRTKIMHELVHVRSPFNRGNLGRSVEERRAELFSGDKSTYYDIKQMFIYSEVFSGVSMLDLLQEHPTDAYAFYLLLYSRLGVSGANHVVASWPGAYTTSSSDAQQTVYDFTNNLDGIIRVSIAHSNSQDMNQRIKARYEKLLGIFKTKERVIQDIDNNLAQNYKMPRAAAEMKLYINSLK